MRIITNDRYDYLLNKIKTLRAENKALKNKNKQLDKENGILRAAISDQDIDFPNSCEESQEFFEEWL